MSKSAENIEAPRPRIVRSAFSEIPRVYAPIEGESLTHQSFKEECDINNILRKFAKGELVPNYREGAYQDNPSLDLHTALNMAIEVNRAYAEATPQATRSNAPGAAFAWLVDRMAMNKQGDSGNSQADSSAGRGSGLKESGGAGSVPPVPPSRGESRRNSENSGGSPGVPPSGEQ